MSAWGYFMRALVIEDEPMIAEAIRDGLEEEGFQVEVAGDGRTGLALAQGDLFGVIVLDVMLPVLDGWQICRRLRDEGNATPVLMLTARGAPDDRVRGLDMGADDYLPKPFHFPELLARVRALLRRDKLYRGRTLRVADLEIDTRARNVKRAGRRIFLTPREYSLLESLAAREGQTLTRTEIQERIWMDDQSLESYSNTVDVHIGQLRRKIDRDYPVKLIQTVRGIGYTLRRPQMGRLKHGSVVCPYPVDPLECRGRDAHPARRGCLAALPDAGRAVGLGGPGPGTAGEALPGRQAPPARCAGAAH